MSAKDSRSREQNDQGQKGENPSSSLFIGSSNEATLPDPTVINSKVTRVSNLSSDDSLLSTTVTHEPMQPGDSVPETTTSAIDISTWEVFDESLTQSTRPSTVPTSQDPPRVKSIASSSRFPDPICLSTHPAWETIRPHSLSRPNRLNRKVELLRQRCLEIFLFLLENNCIFNILDSYCKDDFNLERFRLSLTQNPALYCLYNKIGSTGSGNERIIRDHAYQQAMKDVIQLCDFWNIPDPIEAEFISKLKHLAIDFSFGIESIPTYFDLGEEPNEDELPMALRLFFHSIAYSLQESASLGNASRCRAFLPTMARLVVETGSQIFYAGWTINHHHWMNGYHFQGARF